MPHEQGASLVEVLVASAMAAILGTAFLLIFSSLGRGVVVEQARANALGEAQAAVAEFSAAIRQGVAISEGGPIVESLDSTWPTAHVVFYSDQFEDAPGPERYRYYLTNCSATSCDLARAIGVSNTTTPPHSYADPPSVQVLVTGVLASNALFSGVSWASGSEVVVSSCDSTHPCRLTSVRLSLRVDSVPDLDTEPPLQIQREIGLRNASR